MLRGPGVLPSRRVERAGAMRSGGGVCNFRRLWAAAASNHSLWQASRPRRDIMVSFWQALTWPNTGSTICALACSQRDRGGGAFAGSLERWRAAWPGHAAWTETRCCGWSGRCRPAARAGAPARIDDELVEYARPRRQTTASPDRRAARHDSPAVTGRFMRRRLLRQGSNRVGVEGGFGYVKC